MNEPKQYPWNLPTCGCSIVGDPAKRQVRFTFENDEGYEAMMKLIIESEDMHPVSVSANGDRNG